MRILSRTLKCNHSYYPDFRKKEETISLKEYSVSSFKGNVSGRGHLASLTSDLMAFWPIKGRSATSLGVSTEYGLWPITLKKIIDCFDEKLDKTSQRGSSRHVCFKLKGLANHRTFLWDESMV